MVTEVVEILVRQRGAGLASAQIRGIGTASAGAAASVRLLTRALAAVGIAIGAREIVQTADEFTELQNALRVVTDSAEEQAAVFQEIRRVANETRSPIEAVANQFRRFSIATESLGISQARVIRVVDGLNRAIAASGVSAREGAQGLIQLGQGLQSSRLSGDELRSVLENLPPIAIALADAMGVTIGQLREMGEEGELTTERTFTALEEAVPAFVEAFDSITPTVASVFIVLRNELTVTIGVLDRILGASNTVTESVLELADGFGDRLLNALADAVDGLSSVLQFGADVTDTFDVMGLELGNLGEILGLLAQSFSTFFSAVQTGALALLTVLRGIAVTVNLIRQQTAGPAIAELETQVRNLERLIERSGPDQIGAGGISLGRQLAQARENLEGLRASQGDTAGDLAESLNLFEDAQGRLVTSSQETNDELGRLGEQLQETIGAGAIGSLTDQFRGAAEGAEGAAARIREAAGAEPVDTSILDQPREGDPPRDEEPSREERSAMTDILNITQRLRVIEAERASDADAQVVRLNQQKKELEEAAAVLGDQSKAARVSASSRRRSRDSGRISATRCGRRRTFSWRSTTSSRGSRRQTSRWRASSSGRPRRFWRETSTSRIA